MFLSKKKRLYCCFIDYRCAFNSIDRICLWSRLISYGINGNILKIVKRLYCDYKACIRNNGSLIDQLDVSVDLLQGDKPSPCLFFMYIKDLKAI